MTRTQLLAATTAVALVAVVGAGVVTGLRGDGKLTPCEAAINIVNDVRDEDPQIVGYVERSSSGGYGVILRRLTVGGIEDVEGKASPEVAVHLRRVADDLATAEAAGPGEFTTGKTGRDMDALVAACDAES